MTLKLIKQINDLCPENQGIFVQGSGIPVDIKEPCLYSRWDSGGAAGGSCWDEGDDEGAISYEGIMPDNVYAVVDITLNALGIKDIPPYLRNLIMSRWDYNIDTDHEYYGNYTDWKVEFMKVSELEHVLKSLNLIS